MNDLRNPRTKPEAIAFVSAILKAGVPQVLKSPDFDVAINLSNRFDITVADVLEYRRRLVSADRSGPYASARDAAQALLDAAYATQTERRFP